MNKKLTLRKRAISIFNFFKNKKLHTIHLYFDKYFNDYYIVVENDVYDTDEFNTIINEYMRKFDISHIHVIPQKCISNTDDLTLVHKFETHKLQAIK